MVLNRVHRNHKAYRTPGRKGVGGMEVGEGGDRLLMYTYCYTVTSDTIRSDCYIKMGSDD